MAPVSAVLPAALDPEADLAVVAAAVAEEQEAAVDGVEAEVEAAAELPTPTGAVPTTANSRASAIDAARDRNTPAPSLPI